MNKYVFAKELPKKYVLLEEGEKREMIRTCKTPAEVAEFWKKKLAGFGCMVNKITCSIQLKDQNDQWMNVFKVGYE